ncbi:MAG: DNA translocase FtsK 4TM domain-containing protein [Myxococcota bacterium]|jgi:S-DNA-T family DNA segregation ATPase FtsK/SpoIIIE|nr:DNA translocase FtsK 4TM domain-containing protein [Myxococcota bacterium]
MARAKAARAADAGESFAARVTSEAAGLLLVGFGLIAALSLSTYSPADPVFEIVEVHNRIGPVGATVAGSLLGLLGYGAIVVVGAAGYLGARLLLGRGVPDARSRFWFGTVLLVIGATTLPFVLHHLAPGRLGTSLGGSLGEFLVTGGEMLLGQWGALMLSAAFCVVGVLSVLGISTGRALSATASGSAYAGRFAADGLVTVAARIRGVLEPLANAVPGLAASAGQVLGRFRLPTSKRNRRLPEASEEEDLTWSAEEEKAEDEDWEYEEGEEAEEASDDSEDEEWEYEEGEEGEEGEYDEEEWEYEDEEDEQASPSAGAGKAASAPHIVDHERDRAKSRKPSQETFEFKEDGPLGPYRLPDISLFHRPDKVDLQFDRDSLLMNSRILEKKLADFGVEGRVVRVHPGPVITMYEYEPGAGVKVNRIVNLTDDLAMALRAISIRIIAPLPGKSVVGIEIPNPERETVYLQTLLESEIFRKSKSILEVAMGHDIFGNAVSSDLAKMPHLLVAGATGTGKSVFLNAFLCSLLCRARPDELKLLLVDPKLLELSIYEGIPHLIAEVVTSPKRASAALQAIVRKMEDRYQRMSALRVRNISQFNAKVDADLAEGKTTYRLRPKPGETEGEEVEYERLPYIVVVIDELADLMVTAAKDVEESLQRLAQMARAAGIHLVLATQRPSVDVLTGVIKANFPSRVSFQVSSGTDSRTVLDQKGAENLLGNGDMLFLPPGTSVAQRLHGAFVTEKEVQELVAHLRDQGKPTFDVDLVKLEFQNDSDSEAGDGSDVDEMFDQAVAIVAETRNASISYIQRRLKIGYNRAARIIEEMENQGMVGPQVGTRGRDVFLPAADPDEYE